MVQIVGNPIDVWIELFWFFAEDRNGNYVDVDDLVITDHISGDVFFSLITSAGNKRKGVHGEIEIQGGLIGIQGSQNPPPCFSSVSGCLACSASAGDAGSGQRKGNDDNNE